MASVNQYNANTNFKNQESYLKKLQQSGNNGEKKWAQTELKSLYEAADDVAKQSAYSVNAGTVEGVDSSYLFGRNTDTSKDYKNYNAYKDYYEQQKQTKAALAGIERQLPALNRYYDSLQTLYLQKQQQQQKLLPQKLAAVGLTGGAAAKEQGAVQADYEALLQKNEAARKATLAELQENISALREKGSAEIAQSAAKWQKKLAELWQEYEKLTNA